MSSFPLFVGVIKYIIPPPRKMSIGFTKKEKNVVLFYYSTFWQELQAGREKAAGKGSAERKGVQNAECRVCRSAELRIPCRGRRSTAVRSRRGSDNALRCHSLPRRRFATPTVQKQTHIVYKKRATGGRPQNVSFINCSKIFQCGTEPPKCAR